jgi:hypothetical protein
LAKKEMAAVLILTFLSIAVTGGILYLVFSLLSGHNPGKRKVQDDLDRMKKELDPYVKDLVPIHKEELELFSLSQIHQLSRRKTRTARGVYTTIFHEPILAYSYKRYLSKKLNAVMYARTSDHEFAFRIKDGEVRVVIDNQLVGVIKNNDALYSAKDNRMIARIGRDQEAYLPVFVHNREVAQVARTPKVAAEKLLSTRAFSLVKGDLNKEEQQLLLSLSILELVNREVVPRQ